MAAQTRSSTIFVGNIPYDADDAQLREIFGRAGPVENLRLVFDKDTRQPKGYGFCDFVDPDSAVKAIKELSDVECNGRRLRLDLADNALRGKGGGKGGPLALGDAPGFEDNRGKGGKGGAQMSMPGGGGRGADGPPGMLPAGSLPPDIERKLREAKNAPSPEAVASEVSAHTETAQIVSSMPKVQLQLCLGAMQRLAEEAPESARALLQNEPQLCYALLQAQMLLGLDDEPVLPPDASEIQQLKMHTMRPGGYPGAMPGLFGMPAGMNPLLGLLGGRMPAGMAGLTGMQFPRMPMPPPAPGFGLGHGLSGKAAMPRPPPAPLRPGIHTPSPMDIG